MAVSEAPGNCLLTLMITDQVLHAAWLWHGIHISPVAGHTLRNVKSTCWIYAGDHGCYMPLSLSCGVVNLQIICNDACITKAMGVLLLLNSW